jgi:hypothetical protein
MTRCRNRPQSRRFVPVAVVLCIVLWPLVMIWPLAGLVRRLATQDYSPAARRERRVARLLRWYPEAWRTRHGDAFAALLEDTIDDGRGGLRVSVNVAREGLAARLETVERRPTVAGACWVLGSVTLIPQGLVPLVMLLTEVPTRSWFLALYLPPPFSWPTAAVMIAVGLTMLAIAGSTARRLRSPLQLA